MFLSVDLMTAPPVISVSDSDKIASEEEVSPTPTSPTDLPPYARTPDTARSSKLESLLNSLPIDLLASS